MAAKKKKSVTSVERSTDSRILIPEGMAYSTAREYLKRQEEAEEQFVNVNEPFHVLPLDGAHALGVVLRKRYNWDAISAKTVRTMFGDMEVPPDVHRVPVSHDEHVNVLWGKAPLPVFGGSDQYIETGFHQQDGIVRFRLTGKVRRKNLPEVAAITKAMREHLAAGGSLYSGKAVLMQTDQRGNFDPMERPPAFLDLTKVDRKQLMLRADIEAQLDAFVWRPIERSPAARTARIPLRRGVLLAGPYGTGKTLAAYITARIAQDNGWTFIYVDRSSALETALKFARDYQPAVVFAEDIDRVMAGEERTEAHDAVLNTIDGVTTKDAEIMVVLTTNHAETLNPALLRPGRLDVVLDVPPPDAETVGRLIRYYSGDPTLDAPEAAAILNGLIPATVREAVERAKLAGMTEDGSILLDSEAMTVAARSIRTQHEMLASLRAEPAAPDVTELLTRPIITAVDRLAERVDRVDEYLRD